jgi:predicted deacetylase
MANEISAVARSSKMVLLRFDDICPTMNWKAWVAIEAAMAERSIKPILAVVPDNRDPTLMVDAPVRDFWERMRQCQARGWTMALHGYQHVYTTKNAGLAGRRKKSEFAGLPEAQQEQQLYRGLEILQREGIRPTVWIAPGHSFDGTTVSLLRRRGISIINDGIFRYPHRTNDGTLWIPMQWHDSIVPLGNGVWTICYHINRWGSAEVTSFGRNLDRHLHHIVSVDDVVAAYGERRRHWTQFGHRSPRLAHYLLRLELMTRAIL